MPARIKARPRRYWQHRTKYIYSWDPA